MLQKKLGFLDDRLVFMEAVVLCTEKRAETYADGEKFFNEVQNQVSDYNVQAGEGANKMFATANSEFARYRTMKASYEQTIIGVSLSVSCCFLILLLTTCNWLISLYSTVVIGAIILNLMSVT